MATFGNTPPTMYSEIPFVTLANMKDKDHGINYDGNDHAANAGWTKTRGALIVVQLTATTHAFAMSTGASATSAWMVLDGTTTNQTPA